MPCRVWIQGDGQVQGPKMILCRCRPGPSRMPFVGLLWTSTTCCCYPTARVWSHPSWALQGRSRRRAPTCILPSLPMRLGTMSKIVPKQIKQCVVENVPPNVDTVLMINPNKTNGSSLSDQETKIQTKTNEFGGVCERLLAIWVPTRIPTPGTLMHIWTICRVNLYPGPVSLQLHRRVNTVWKQVQSFKDKDY